MNLTTLIRASFLVGVIISIFVAADSKPVTGKWAHNNRPIKSAYYNQPIKSTNNLPQKSSFASHKKNLHDSGISEAEFLQPSDVTHPRSLPLEMLSSPSDAASTSSFVSSSLSNSPSILIVPGKVGMSDQK